MRFEDSPEEDYSHRIFLEDEELETVGAAYRELIFNLIRSREMSQVTEAHLTMAGWSRRSDELWLDTNDPLAMAVVLEGFHARTIESVKKSR